jgi:hypothetical protein
LIYNEFPQKEDTKKIGYFREQGNLKYLPELFHPFIKQFPDTNNGGKSIIGTI